MSADSIAEEPAQDPARIIRSRGYVALLVLAALIGVPVSVVAYAFLALVSALQKLLFTDLPVTLGFKSEPLWWPLPLLILSGVLVGLTVRYLPGRGGHTPVDGLKTHGMPVPIELPGVFAAALASLSLGVVLGPEAPLIAIGGGLGVLAVHLLKRDAPQATGAVIAAAGSFAAISTLLGSPILAAFLLMEASGLGGAMLGVVLLPGLLAAGVGSLVFLGLDAWTGLGTFSLTVPGLPPAGSLTLSELFWAVLLGLAAAAVGTVIRRIGVLVRKPVETRLVVVTPLVGVVVAACAIAFAALTGRSSSEVLFSGQNALGPLLDGAAGWSVAALLALIVFKSLAYGVSLGSFRGGPVFPSLFIGAAGGIAASHLPGLGAIEGAAIGMGAMCAVMLRLPLTSVMLATLLLGSTGLKVMPLVIIAVVVAFVAAGRLDARSAKPAPEAAFTTGPDPARATAPVSS